jgi:hypothetical protein
MKRKHLVDVTEIFRQLHVEKKYRMIKLAFYFALFIITIYRFEADYFRSIMLILLDKYFCTCIHMLVLNMVLSSLS